MEKKSKNVHYVNNKEFHEALIVYKKQCDVAKEAGLPRPKISNYVGECFLKIATHLSYLPKFVNYMFRDDMISDAVENAVQYIDRFDTERNNPFAYFTQICYYAFLRRIAKEKKQIEIKDKLLERTSFEEVFTADEHYNSSDYNSIKDKVYSKYS